MSTRAPDTDAERSVYLVMVCDNQDGEDDFAHLFAMGMQAAAPGTIKRPFKPDGPVCATPNDLLLSLRDRLDKESRLPDLIILDHRFGDEDKFGNEPTVVQSEPFPRYPEFEFLAFDTLVGIKALFREHPRCKMPPVVLRSGAEGELGLPDFYAFVQLGGSQVVYKRMTAATQLAILQKALDGERWEPGPRDEDFTMNTTEGKWARVLLPAFEAGMGVDEAGRWLEQQPEHPWPQNWDALDESFRAEKLRQSCRKAVEKARSELNNDPALARHIPLVDPDWPGLAKGGCARVLALAAAHAGEMFIPIRHQKHFDR